MTMAEHKISNSATTVTGVIDPGYTSGDPNVTVGTDTTLSGPYQHLSSYTPVASDSVILISLGTTWVILGRPA
jgi:hypothetical protein